MVTADGCGWNQIKTQDEQQQNFIWQHASTQLLLHHVHSLIEWLWRYTCGCSAAQSF
jgi:hypothetical protein